MAKSMFRFQRCVTVLLLLALAAAPAVALEVREGRMKLILHEDLGRFTLYYLTDLQRGTYVPLFVDTDPRTSTTTLVVDNRVSRLGESSEFQQEARRTARGADFIWSSRILQVQQSFEFVTSASAQLADGVRITLTVKNLGEASLQVACRFLIDTYLGEEGSYHFIVDGQKQISRETELSGASRPAYCLSPRHNDAAGLGLLFLTGGEGIDAPDRLVFANWQRLNDSSWSYQTSGSRSFSNLPYSINDSAIAAYYGPRTVESGKSLSITTVLASAVAGGYRLAPAGAVTAAQQPKTTPQLLDAIASTGGIADPLLAAGTDLRVLNDLLRTIDSRLGAASELTQEELDALRGALQELRARVHKYAGEQTSASARP